MIMNTTSLLPALDFPGFLLHNNPAFERQPSIIEINAGKFQPFFDYINEFSGMNLSANEKFQIMETVKIKTLRRRQYLLQEGDICKYMAFIVKGSMRMFSVNEKGQESILSFGIEQNWVFDQESFSMLKASRYQIEALEDSLIIMISSAQLQILIDQIPAVDKMIRLAICQQVICIQKRIHAAISMSAEERYRDLLATNPDYTQRFSQNMIASYLGIKSETLSRVRKK